MAFPIAVAVGTGAARLAPKAWAMVTAALRKRGINLKSDISRAYNTIVSTIRNNSTTAALIGYEVARVGGEIDWDTFNSEYDNLPPAVQKLIDEARQGFATLQAETGDQAQGLSPELLHAHAFLENQQYLLNNAVAALGSRAAFLAVYKAVHLCDADYLSGIAGFNLGE